MFKFIPKKTDTAYIHLTHSKITKLCNYNLSKRKCNNPKSFSNDFCKIHNDKKLREMSKFKELEQFRNSRDFVGC